MIISNALYNSVSQIESPENGDMTLHSTHEMPRKFMGVAYDQVIVDIWDNQQNSSIAARSIFLMEGRIVRVDFKHWNGRHVTYWDERYEN